MPNVKLSGVEISSEAFLSPEQTWVTKRDGIRPAECPMRVLCLGLSRTGTVSLRIALAELGYRPYHGFSLMENPPDSHLWRTALNTKLDPRQADTPWIREDFEQILADFDACLDVPATIFAEELIEAYPEAKVIVTVRDVDSWYSSWMATIKQKQTLVGRFQSFWLRLLDKSSRLYLPVMEDCVDLKYGNAFEDEDPEKAKNIYRRHVSRIRELAPDCLLFDVRDGWAPLCHFLEQDIPKDEHAGIRPFPRLNNQRQWNELFESLTSKVLRKRAGDMAVMGAMVGVGLGLLSLAWSQGRPLIRT